jgi:prevent-host-death family protein
VTTPLIDCTCTEAVVTAYPVTMAEDIPQEPGIRELKARLSDYVGRTVHRDEPVFVTRNGKRVIALVPAEWAEQMLAERAAAASAETESSTS